MKGMDLFCSSPASTEVISSMDNNQRFQFLRRRNPKSYDAVHHDPRRKLISQLPRVPCSSSSHHFPVNPKPYSDIMKKKKKASSSSSEKQNDDVPRRKSCVELSDLYDNNSHCHYPATSSSRRYLLRNDDVPFIDWVSSHAEQIPEIPKNKHSSSSPAPPKDQVVVLRVSLHCKGCEGKVRKHISKMKGVRSYSIDLETKKVTVVGDVTPLGVLASVSKVKKAQLWPSSSPSSTTPFLWSTISS